MDKLDKWRCKICRNLWVRKDLLADCTSRCENGTIAYTMGNKSNYDKSLNTEPVVTKIGRTDDYSGGCCWPTYNEAAEWIEKHSKDIPYTPEIYVISLPNCWQEDTSRDTYEDEGFHSLLTDAPVSFL